MTPPNRTLNFSIEPHELYLRFDALLKARFPQESRTFLQALIDGDQVLVNGQPVKKREKLRSGDLVSITWQRRPPTDLTPEEGPLDILFEDEAILVVNKPEGLCVHPGAGHSTGTLIHAVLAHCPILPLDPLRPGIVHRLDKDTSGVMVIAKTEQTHRTLVEAFAKRLVRKTYFALCLGCPRTERIVTQIARHPTRRQEMAVVKEGGKEAITECIPLKTEGELTFVKLLPHTGRTHQLRVHLKEIGHPILGDPLYGRPKSNQKYGVTGQLLHAARLELLHPLIQKTVVFEAPFPKRMLQFSQFFLEPFPQLEYTFPESVQLKFHPGNLSTDLREWLC